MSEIEPRTRQVADIIANTLTAWPEMTWEDAQDINARTGWTHVAHTSASHDQSPPLCPSGLRLDPPQLRQAWNLARQLLEDAAGDDHRSGEVR